MRLSPSVLRANRRLLPGVALLVGMLFLTGQTFNCCRVNESVSASLKHLIALASHPQAPHVHADNEGDADAHPHCHGHGTAAHTQAPTELAKGDFADSRYDQDGSCLSEKSFAGKPMLASEAAASGMAMPVLTVTIAVFAMPTPFFERPRPQNKSSPPLYLTTLRILV